MIARIRKAAENKDSGFTLIELLVVMIIIGILAAIAIPAFLSQKAKARDTSAKADVSTIGKEVAAYYVDGGAALEVVTSGNEWILQTPGDATASPAVPAGEITRGPLSGTGADANTATGAATSADDFCVSVTAPNGSTGTFYYSEEGLSTTAC